MKYIEKQKHGVKLEKKAVKSAGITIITRFIGQIVQLAGTMILARILVPSDFGLVAMVTSISGLFSLFSDLGLTDATVQNDKITQDQASTLFWIIVIFNFFTAFCLIILSPYISIFYNDYRVRLIFIAISTQFIFMGLSNQHFALLKRDMQFLKVSFSDLTSLIIANILAIVTALHGFHYWSLVTRAIVFVFFKAIAGWVLFKWHPNLIIKQSHSGSLIKFGLITTLSLGFLYLLMNLDKTLVGKVFGAEELGFYNRAFGLFMLPVGQLTSPLHHVAVSTLSKLRTDYNEFRRFYLRAISAISFLGMPLAAFLVIESSDLIYIFFGNQWQRSVELLSILALSAGIKMIYDTNQWLNVSLGKADRRLKWNIFSFCVTIGSIIIGLFFSTKGVASAYSIVTFVLFIPGLLYAGKPIKLRINEIFNSFWKYALAATLAGMICSQTLKIIGLSWNEFYRLIIALLFYIAIYLLIIIGLYQGIKPIKQFISLISLFVSKN